MEKAAANLPPQKNILSDLRILFPVRDIDSLNICTYGSQLAHQILIAAFNMEDTVDLSNTGSGQTGNDHSSARAQITGLHLSAGKALYTLNDSNLSVYLNLSAIRRNSST